MDIANEKQCNMLETLFQNIISDLKTSSPAWDEFVSKGYKLHSLLKSTTIAMSAFIETIQKIADTATHSKGSTKDVGSALTRICVRQRMVESKLKQFTMMLMDNLLCPVQEKLEEWKKVASQLEKEHAKEYKRATNEIKKRSNDTLRLQKKVRKGGKPDVQHQLNAAMHDVNQRFNLLEETERAALRNLLVEERTRVCLFANCLSPLLDVQVSMLNDANHLQDLNAGLSDLCRNPKQLPSSTEQLINDFVSAGCHPENIRSAVPSRSSTSGSEHNPLNKERKSSAGDHANGLNRSATVRLRHNEQPALAPRHRRTSSGEFNTVDRPSSFDSDRFSSVSSRDSGFVSVEATEVTSASTFKVAPSVDQTKNENLTSSLSRPNKSTNTAHSLTNQNNKFSWKNWSIPGPYDLMAAADNNVKEATNVAPPPLSPKPAYFVQYPITNSTSSNNFPQSNSPAAFTFPPPLSPADNGSPETSALVESLPPPPPAFFSNGDEPHLNHNGSSSSALHPTSCHLQVREGSVPLVGKSSSDHGRQSPSPLSTEGAIPSHDSNLVRRDETGGSNRRNCEKFSTLPRNYQHVWPSNIPSTTQHRPVSTAGIKASHLSGSHSDVSRIATIRRNPSSKLGFSRSSGLVPVRTPSVPSGGAVANLLSTFAPPSRVDSGGNSF